MWELLQQRLSFQSSKILLRSVQISSLVNQLPQIRTLHRRQNFRGTVGAVLASIDVSVFENIVGAALAAIELSAFENITTKRLDLIAGEPAPTNQNTTPAAKFSRNCGSCFSID
jgi:hypothetical protein